MTIFKGLDIKITAYRADDDEPWRLDRLERILEEISELDTSGKLLRDIDSIYDKKGCVMITWKTKEPDKAFKDKLNSFWHAIEQELAVIEHQTIN